MDNHIDPAADQAQPNLPQGAVPNREQRRAKSRPGKQEKYEAPAPGSTETELGVPIPGVVLPADQWVNTALKRLPDQGTLNFDELFGRTAPLALDIGCGNGRFVLSSAVRRPDWNHIGIDILPMVIRYATRRANQRGLNNCRFAASDGWRFLHQLSAHASIDEIHVYHPQPYADEHRHHMRVMTPEFLALVHRVLRPGGKLFLQTDNPAYWAYIEEVVSSMMDFHLQDTAWPEDPLGRSRREIIAIEQGLKIFRGWADRRDTLEESTLDAIVAQLPQPNFKATEHRAQTKRKRPLRRRR